MFDYVEIDSTFYRIPNVFAVKNWYKKTSKDFKFTAKFPKVITHDKRLKDVDNDLEHFFNAIGPLSDKTLALLIQLPPCLQIYEVELDTRFSYAVEVRHPSWFQDLAYNFFSNNGICLVWSELTELKTPPVVAIFYI